MGLVAARILPFLFFISIYKRKHLNMRMILIFRCCCTCKGTKFLANHNKYLNLRLQCLGVVVPAKVQNF